MYTNPTFVLQHSLFSIIDLLWTAPELLSDTRQLPKGSKEGDVYSFAIILHEIIYRMGTFAGHGSLTHESLYRVLS